MQNPSRTHLSTIGAALAVASAPLLAQKPLSLADTRQTAFVGAPTVSADGKTAAFTVSRPNYKVNRSESKLWTVELSGGAPRLLTPSRAAVSAPQWAPTGRALAFLSPDSAGRNQVWVLPGDAGEARQVTWHSTPVERYDWRPDGKAIAFVASDEEPRREGEERFVTSFEVGAEDLFLRRELRAMHLWVAMLDDAPARRLTSGSWTVQFSLPPGPGGAPIQWSPDGTRITFTRQVAPETGKGDSTHVAIVDVASGNIRGVTGEQTFERAGSFSPDGKSILFLQPRERQRMKGYLSEAHIAPAEGGAARSLTRALDRHILRAEWLADGSGVLVAGGDRGTVGLWVQPLSGNATRVDLGDLVLTGGFGADVERTGSGAFVFTATSPTRAAEIYVKDDLNAAPRRLTDFNGWITQVALGKQERVTWKSDQFEPDGVVTYPPGFDASKRYPLVLVIHGGPTASSKVAYSALAQLIAADGAIVFEPNYRGSDNLGNAFQSAINGDAGAGPGRDVMAGVRMLRSKPYVDGSRTVVTGWSYGGFMTTWMIGNYPNEWTAAMSGAPVTSWEDQYNYGDSNINRRYGFGGSPWTGGREKEYQAQSPITYARKIRTPTLIMSHMEDFRVPPTQALALYRALQDNGVESRFIGFPGRTHNPTDPVMQLERTRLWTEFVRERIAPRAQ